MAKSTYKPLLLTTTLRAPERLKLFLNVLHNFDGQVLTNDLIRKICIILIRNGLYKPTHVSTEVRKAWKDSTELSEEEATKVYDDNPQDHKEAGFDKGWPSRFDTWFKIAKELGFIWYELGQEIYFSNSGTMLIDEENPQNELIVFANAFAKYQRNNPLRKVLNENIPLLLLLETIILLKNDPKFKASGISSKEIPLVLCWQNNDSHELYKYIVGLREKYGFSPSHEVILYECHKLLNATKRDSYSLLKDYPDEFVRKMRLTGLITIRGGGRFIDINSKEEDAVAYILERNREIKVFANAREYFDYMAEIDLKLVEKLYTPSANMASTSELEKWKDYYGWDKIKIELEILSRGKESNDDVLKIIEGPLRLEFLTTLAIMKRLPMVDVLPNFTSDDEGLPSGCAGGGKPDILCIEKGNPVLVEVTLLTGTQQYLREAYSIRRHIGEFKEQNKNSYAIFISPKGFIDTIRYFAEEKRTNDIDVRVSDISDFAEELESVKTLNEISH